MPGNLQGFILELLKHHQAMELELADLYVSNQDPAAHSDALGGGATLVVYCFILLSVHLSASKTTTCNAQHGAHVVNA